MLLPKPARINLKPFALESSLNCRVLNIYAELKSVSQKKSGGAVSLPLFDLIIAALPAKWLPVALESSPPEPHKREYKKRRKRENPSTGQSIARKASSIYTAVESKYDDGFPYITIPIPQLARTLADGH